MKKMNLYFKSILTLLLFCYTINGYAQSKTENLIVVTLDGFRWQEVFRGIDSTLTETKEYNSNIKELYKTFGASTPQERRQLLMPFLWKTISQKGQIWGNRQLGNYVNVANPHWFSYPGYNEIFTGYPDTTINSNDKILNPHENVLEFLNRQKGFEDKVAAFTSWDVFPFIFNEPRANFTVNGGFEDVKGKINEAQRALNEMQWFQTPFLGDVRFDFSTYQIAKEYIRQNKTRVLYLGFDETDDLAHEGHYNLYAQAAHKIDTMLADFWHFVQMTPQYKDKTTLLITCDHGRGDDGKRGWRDHGTGTKDSDQIWFAVIGPDTPAKGEISKAGQWHQKQFAATIAQFLGFEFKPQHPTGEPIKEILQQKN